MEYAGVELGSLKQSLTSFAEHISAVQDYRQAQVMHTLTFVMKEAFLPKILCSGSIHIFMYKFYFSILSVTVI